MWQYDEYPTENSTMKRNQFVCKIKQERAKGDSLRNLKYI